MNVLTRLLEHAATTPDRVAIIDRDGRQISYAGLAREGARFAALLHSQGVRRGDTVLVLVPMSIELYATLAGVFALGAVVMVLDPSAGLAHLERCCALRSPQALIGVPLAHLLSLAVPSLRRVALRVCAKGWWPGAVPWGGGSGSVELGEEVNTDAPALLTFTSGTSGTPKAALRTHGLLLAQLAALETLLAPEEGDVDLATLAIVALANLATGVTTVIPDASLRRPASLNARPVLEQIARHGVTRTAASPALLERLADVASKQRLSLPGLKRIYSGGGPVFPRVLHKLARVAPNARLISVYGSTEAEPIAHIAFQDLSASDLEAVRGGQGLLVGPPVEAIDLRIMPNRAGELLEFADLESFEAVTLGAGEIGEIVVCGPHVLPGYLGGVGDGETKFRVNGRVWHRTGDAGHLDVQGRLWLAGRAGARILDARGELYPFSTECAALEVPGVRRCALLGHRGGRVLCVEWEKGRADKKETEVLLERLAWAHVDRIVTVKSLPMDARHNAKVDLGRLRKLLTQDKLHGAADGGISVWKKTPP